MMGNKMRGWIWKRGFDDDWKIEKKYCVIVGNGGEEKIWEEE